MGATILLQFNKETLANFPRIIKTYVHQQTTASQADEILRASNLLKSMETTTPSLEEIPSGAS